MALSGGGLTVLVIIAIFFVTITLVLVYYKCRSKPPEYQLWNPLKETKEQTHKTASKHSHTSTTPLVSNKHSSNPTHLVIPFTSSTPKITTIHIPITSARYRSDSDSSSNSSSEEEGALEPIPGEGHGAGDGERDGLRGAGGAGDITSDGRDADGEDSAPCTPEINVESIGSRPRSNTGGPSGSKSATESDYEEAAYSVYQHEKDVLRSLSTNKQDKEIIVDNHLLQPTLETKKKRKRRVLSVPHITLPTRLQRKSEGASSSIYDHSLMKSRFGSADSILGLVEPIGKLFIRIRHNSTEEKLILLINKVKDLQLPAGVKLSKSLNPVLYIKGGFLPTMGQRFTTKYAPLAENVTWCNEFSILGVSKSAAWQLTMRLHLCYRENKLDRIQIIGVCDVVLGQINLENSQEITLNFFSSERQCSDLGDIHVSLCYQPQLRRIVFLIIEARDLPRSTLFGSIHSVAKVEMLCSRKRLEKQKSRVVREAHNPVWNNQIVFTVPEANTKLQDILFVVTVLHVDMVKGGHVVGKCELGWSATCEELDQWNQVMQNPNRPIPMWLGLQYPD
ncbi:uncharacterized protein [Asterias amurensis]|uniref:uncharacterized protein isoform X2 n=1 Tax=Asterias amurensis TaxID=7602 RepID=UPI003AB33FCC